jgi:acyl-[acyl-carrier-protein]-phospholipid O-acyltransferase/long-chain-fatty-acid--[acyl-carrier-protein] ligase
MPDRTDIDRTSTQAGYGPLLKDGPFEAFLWTQFLGAFNDNVFKMIVSVFAVSAASGSNISSRNLALAGAVFVLPFLLFAGYSGQLTDRFSKTRVLQITKSLEILTMLLAIAALMAGRIEYLLVVLFLLATQANFFSPAKYGILPEVMTEGQLSRANGLLELTTFVAIVIGTSFGTFLFQHWQHTPLRMGLVMLAIALAGSLASLGIFKVPAAGSRELFHWNPFYEIVEGARVLRARKPLALAVYGISWFWFVGALFQLALLLLGAEVLHVSETQVGLLVAALAAGIGLGSVAAGALSGDYIELGLVPVGAALMGIFSVALGLTHNYAYAMFCLVAIGAGGGFFAVPLNAYLQEQAAPTEKGRILATNNFANMVGVILASGFLWALHDKLHWNSGIIILALGIMMIAGSALLALRMPETMIRFILWGAIMTMFRARFEGRENIPRIGPALLVSNHISYADALLVGAAIRRRTIHFLMWEPIFDVPVANYFFRVLQAIPIDESSPKGIVRALRAAREQLERGALVGIFPEGSITHSGEVERFERGFEKILHGTGAPIIPIRIDGLYGHPLSCKGGAPFRSWKKLWRPVVTVRIGTPIHRLVTGEELRQTVLSLKGPASPNIKANVFE